MEPSFDVSQYEPLLQELAALSLLEYDQRRRAEARDLGIRVSTLDAAVAARRSHPIEASDAAGIPPLFPPVESWPTAVDAPHCWRTSPPSLRAM
jgi:hypothetical protein